VSAAIVGPSGAPAAGPSTYEPPKGSSGFFGWVDIAADPCSIRFDDIIAVLRNQQTGRFMILLRNCPLTPTISDRDAERLMKRMGWTKE
jgi:hypothetical protein